MWEWIKNTATRITRKADIMAGGMGQRSSRRNKFIFNVRNVLCICLHCDENDSGHSGKCSIIVVFKAEVLDGNKRVSIIENADYQQAKSI